jgi:LysM repeat protein
MARTYTVAKGDTLGKIARAQLGDTKLAARIADYNGLPDANRIFVGQQLQLPTAKDMRPTVVAPQADWPAPPHGFQGICDAFGNLPAYIRDDGTLDPQWESERLTRAALPFPIPLSWDTTQNVMGIRCHKLIAPLVEEVFRQIAAQGLKNAIQTYGGCFAYRPKRLGTKPSTHSWGIALDLNPNTNAMGTVGNMDPRLVELLEGYGFIWGGRWAGKNKDPMHFQYCSGY